MLEAMKMELPIKAPRDGRVMAIALPRRRNRPAWRTLDWRSFVDGSTHGQIAALLVELIEKVGLLRRDMQQKKELEKYEARFQRIEQKFDALAERLVTRRSGAGEDAADGVAAAGPQPRLPQRRSSERSERGIVERGLQASCCTSLSDPTV